MKAHEERARVTDETMPDLQVTALRPGGSLWCAKVCTLPEALALARQVRAEKGWPACIERFNRPSNVRSIEGWRYWQRSVNVQPPRIHVRDMWTRLIRQLIRGRDQMY